MSYDLEVRSDDAYTRSESRQRVVGLLRGLGARATGSATFMLYEDPEKGQTIEIDLGHEGPGPADMVNFVGFGVPYAFLSASGQKVLDLAFEVASQLGWRVYDPQAGRWFDAHDRTAALASQATALGAVEQISEPPRGFISRVIDRLIRQTKFMVIVAGLAFGMIGAYAGWAARQQLHDPRRFVGTILVAAITVIVLRPVILELLEPHQPPR